MFKNGRKITVNGELFHYKVTNVANLAFVVQRASTGVKIQMCFPEDKRKWKTQVTPSAVERFIRKEFFGEEVVS